MQLLWDAYGLSSLHAGIGRHGFQLAEGLSTLGMKPEILPSVPVHKAFEPWLSGGVQAESGRLKNLKPLALGRSLTLAKQKMAPGPMVYHGLSNFNVPHQLPSHCKTVLTLHDLIPLRGGGSIALRAFLRWALPRAIDRADQIICVSRWTEQELHEHFRNARGKSVVIPNGKPAQKNTLPTEPGLRLLTVSRWEGYKRLSLIPAIARALPPGFTWNVVTDSQGVKALRGVPGLRLHQSLSEDDLNTLWLNASCLVHPSLWEGYGLPAAEALSFARPIVYTGGSGLDEVAGEGGIALSRDAGPELWAEAIQSLCRPQAPFHEAIERQWQRLTLWSDVSLRTREVYAKLVRG